MIQAVRYRFTRERNQRGNASRSAKQIRMLADTLPVHAQNFFLACATAIPALFVAISVQRLPWGRPGFVVNIVKIPASPEGPVYDMRIFQGLTLNWPYLWRQGACCIASRGRPQRWGA
jgi:hypothetical protein